MWPFFCPFLLFSLKAGGKERGMCIMCQRPAEDVPKIHTQMQGGTQNCWFFCAEQGICHKMIGHLTIVPWFAALFSLKTIPWFTVTTTWAAVFSLRLPPGAAHGLWIHYLDKQQLANNRYYNKTNSQPPSSRNLLWEWTKRSVIHRLFFTWEDIRGTPTCKLLHLDTSRWAGWRRCLLEILLKWWKTKS